MHIVEGVLSAPVLVTGGIVTLGGLVLGLRHMDLENIPATGMLAAAFFVTSLININIGPSSVHLIMNGLAGLILGWAAFPALFVGLLLQAVFFGFGGIVVLGVNAMNIALPAVAMHFLCRSGLLAGRRQAMLFGAFAGAGSIALTAIMVAFSLGLSGEEFLMTARLAVLAHVPVMIIEGILCAFAVALIGSTKPELLGRTCGFEGIRV